MLARAGLLPWSSATAPRIWHAIGVAQWDGARESAAAVSASITLGLLGSLLGMALIRSWRYQ
ncbi:MAG: hypothetical protein ACPLPR_06860 [Bacillota bacterium]